MTSILIRGLTLGLATLALCGCKASFFAALNAGIEPSKTVTYQPETRLSLDVFRPRSDGQPAPVVIFFYGGRWQSGERSEYAFVGEELASQGILTLIVD